jgi:hypothetical protein
LTEIKDGRAGNADTSGMPPPRSDKTNLKGQEISTPLIWIKEPFRPLA